MEESTFIEKLCVFGLSRQEASIYTCLLKNEALTGYEIGKLTGISRSNVYSTLSALVEKGAAYIVEGASSKYVAVDLREFCDNRVRSMSRLKEELSENIPGKTKTSEGYITIEGYNHICDKIHHMLLGTQMRVYFSSCSTFLSLWKTEIQNLLDRQIKVVLISDREIPVYAKDIEDGRIIFYKTIQSDEENFNCQLRLIIDSEYVLTGEVNGDGCDTCLYSAQKNFVNVFKESMKNEIELIKLKEQTGTCKRTS